MDTPPVRSRRLGDIFVERGLVTSYQLHEALEIQRTQQGKLGEILVALGYTTRVALAGVIAQQWDDRRSTRDAASPPPSVPDAPPPATSERATADLEAAITERDERIRRQAETIDALLDQLATLGPRGSVDFPN